MDSAKIEWPDLNTTEINLVRNVNIGQGLNSSCTPNAMCFLTLDGTPRLCVRLWRGNESYAFRDARFWFGRLVVGWGEAFYVIDVHSLALERHDLDAYFSSFYKSSDFGRADDFLLVASADRVVRLNEDGTVAWTSDFVGIDGVVVHDVKGDVVDGEGEWDPPEGWRRFRLRLHDGKSI